MKIRLLGKDDVDLFVRLRLDYIKEDHGGVSESAVQSLVPYLRSYYEKHIANETLFAIVLEIADEIASTAFLAICEKPPSLSFANGLTGTLLNVMTYPAHRRKGYAAKVIEQAIELAKAQDLRCLDLLATPDGKGLYAKLGFAPLDYQTMRLFI